MQRDNSMLAGLNGEQHHMMHVDVNGKQHHMMHVDVNGEHDARDACGC